MQNFIVSVLIRIGFIYQPVPLPGHGNLHAGGPGLVLFHNAVGVLIDPHGAVHPHALQHADAPLRRFPGLQAHSLAVLDGGRGIVRAGIDQSGFCGLLSEGPLLRQTHADPVGSGFQPRQNQFSLRARFAAGHHLVLRGHDINRDPFDALFINALFPVQVSVLEGPKAEGSGSVGSLQPRRFRHGGRLLRGHGGEHHFRHLGRRRRHQGKRVRRRSCRFQGRQAVCRRLILLRGRFRSGCGRYRHLGHGALFQLRHQHGHGDRSVRIGHRHSRPGKIPACREGFRNRLQHHRAGLRQGHGIGSRLNDSPLQAPLKHAEGALHGNLRRRSVLRRNEAPQPYAEGHHLRLRRCHRAGRKSQHRRQHQYPETGPSSHAQESLLREFQKSSGRSFRFSGRERRSGGSGPRPVSSASRCAGTCHTHC